jgi:hypothetical protein
VGRDIRYFLCAEFFPDQAYVYFDSTGSNDVFTLAAIINFNVAVYLGFIL